MHAGGASWRQHGGGLAHSSRSRGRDATRTWDGLPVCDGVCEGVTELDGV